MSKAIFNGIAIASFAVSLGLLTFVLQSALGLTEIFPLVCVTAVWGVVGAVIGGLYVYATS